MPNRTHIAPFILLINTYWVSYLSQAQFQPLKWVNCDSAYYTVDGGEQVAFESGQAVTIGANAAPLDNVNITLTAVKGDSSYSYEYTFTKNNSRTVYAKNAAGWNDVYIHYWGGESTSVWPGVKMKPYGDSEDVFYCDIPSKSTNYKFNDGGKENAEDSEQTVNLATQDIVEGVSEVFVINPLSEGDSANTGEYVSLDRALSDEPVEGMPIISAESCAPALGEEFELKLNLENVPQLSGYVVNLSYDNSVIAPVSESGNADSKLGNVIYNVKANGDLVLVCSSANAVDYTEKDLLVSVPFKVVASESKQIKVTVKVSDMFADENTEVMKSNVVRSVQQKIGTAFYREYLARMLDLIPDLIDQLKQDETEAPDILKYSSEVIVSIIQENADSVPEYIRPLSLENYFSEQVTGKYAIKTIRTAWKTSRKSFTISRRNNELRYNAGATYEADRLMKELPETLEARKSREWVVMNLEEAKDFFNIDFRGPWFSFL